MPYNRNRKALRSKIAQAQQALARAQAELSGEVEGACFAVNELRVAQGHLKLAMPLARGEEESGR